MTLNPNDPFKCRFKRPENLKNLFAFCDRRTGNWIFARIMLSGVVVRVIMKSFPEFFDLLCVWQSRQSPATAVSTAALFGFLTMTAGKVSPTNFQSKQNFSFCTGKSRKILSYRGLFSKRNFLFVFVLASKATFSAAADNENIFVCLIFLMTQHAAWHDCLYLRSRTSIFKKDIPQTFPNEKHKRSKQTYLSTIIFSRGKKEWNPLIIKN